MSFSVSYIFTARDKYSSIAKKIAIANQSIKRTASQAAISLKSKLKPALNSVNAAGLRAKARMEQLEKSFEGVIFQARRMRNIGLGMSVAITLPFVLAASSAANAASDAEETRSKFATIFRGISSESESVADNFARDFGLAGSSSRKLLGDTADVLTGFGFTQEGALDLSRQVNELAVDLASFTNFVGGAEGASAALTKALLGERESMKSLGVAITEDLVKTKISTLVSEGRTFASLAEAKAIATLAIATEQSKNAVGDYARTQFAAANVARRLQQRTIELKESYGTVLLPVQIKINNALIKMADFLSSLSPNMKKVVLVVGGLVAVMGPLLLIIGTIGLALPALVTGFAAVGTAIAFLGGPMTIIIALTAAIMTFLLRTKTVSNAIGGLMFKIVTAFKAVGAVVGGVISGIVEKIAAAIGFINSIISKIRGFASALGLVDIPDQEISINSESLKAITASPAVATANANATVNGQITVSATEGSRVDAIESESAFGSAQGNIGLGVSG